MDENLIEQLTQLSNDIDQASVLQYSIMAEDSATLKLLLKHLSKDKAKMAESINHKDSHGLTSVHLACVMKNNNMLQLLESHGGDCTVKSNSGTTPFHILVENLNKEALEFLLLRSTKYHAFIYKSGLHEMIRSILGKELLE